MATWKSDPISTRLRETDLDIYDRVKRVGGFLWGVLARWDMVSGQADFDVIERVISKI